MSTASGVISSTDSTAASSGKTTVPATTGQTVATPAIGGETSQPATAQPLPLGFPSDPSGPLVDGGFDQSADDLEGWLVSDSSSVTVNATKLSNHRGKPNRNQVDVYQGFIFPQNARTLSFIFSVLSVDDSLPSRDTPDAFGDLPGRPQQPSATGEFRQSFHGLYYVQDVEMGVWGQAAQRRHSRPRANPGSLLISLDVSALSGQAGLLLFRFIGGSDASQLNGAVTISDVSIKSVSSTSLVADAGANQSVNAGALVTLNGTFNDPGAGLTHTFDWHVTSSNGQTIADGATPQFTYTPDDSGLYTATFTVTNSAGDVDSDSALITVENVPPTASIAGPDSGTYGQTLSYLIGASDPSTVAQAAGFAYSINWDDGSPTQTIPQTADDGSQFPCQPSICRRRAIRCPVDGHR